MIGARLHAVGEGLRVEELSQPLPASDEVQIRVSAAGLCGSDLHIIDGETVLNEYPRVLGHEIAGIITDVGRTVTQLQVGQRVCLSFLTTCGDCRFCLAGRESLCTRQSGVGVHRDGGFAEYLTVPARNVVTVPDDVDLEIAAIVTDALATPYHAVAKRANVRPGHPVGVIGLGGLGTNAIQLLRVFGAGPIIGLDVDESSCRRAERVGASRTFDPRSTEYTEWLRKGRPEIRTVFDFVGHAATVNQGCELASRGGRVVVVGLGVEPLQLPVGNVFTREELEVVGSYAFERKEISELLDLLADHRIDVTESISHRIELANINEGVSHLRYRAGSPSRIVVHPGVTADPLHDR